MKTDWKALCQELLIDYEQHLYRSVLADRVRAALAAGASVTPTESDAFVMGQIGGRPSEAERLAFEAWMRGHSWLVAGTWNGVTYDDRGGNRYSSVDHDAMQTRMLWAAWRDRAALAAEADGPAVQSREPASVATQPSDEELLELSQFHCVSITLNNGSAVSPFVEGTDMRSEVLSFARAAISRYGHQPAPPNEGEAIGPEWQPCVKLPITVHVREQRSGETQVSTREGITPVRPDDLIMRGVQGEEYPIGRELFNKTYRLGTAGHQPAPPAEGEVAELVAWLRLTGEGQPCLSDEGYARLTRAADLLEQGHAVSVPNLEVAS